MKLRRANYITGNIALPGDKSISHRAAMIASIAVGETRIQNFAKSADCESTLKCLKSVGVEIRRTAKDVIITGNGKHGLTVSDNSLDCGNSGTTMRLLSGILSGQPFESTLVGDESLQNRPMGRIIEPLLRMGAVVRSNNEKAPLTILGQETLRAIEYRPEFASAQVKSCVLLAGLFSDGKTSVIETVPTRDHTERMLGWFGCQVAVENLAEGTRISVSGDTQLTARDFAIPGDISAAAFFLVAAVCLQGSDIVLPNVGINPTRRAALDFLRKVGANIQIGEISEICNEPVATLTVRDGPNVFSSSQPAVLGGDIIANLIDEIPILAVLGTQLPGGIEITGAGELRHKESDRIAAIVENLRRMGASVTESPDGFKVERSELRGAVVDAFDDHRMAMAFSIAALIADGETEIIGAECSSVSFPGFFDILRSVVR